MPAPKPKSLIDRHARRVFAVADSRLSAKAEGDPGSLEGYASVWDVLDLQGDIVERGAFTRTIEANVKAGKVKLMMLHYAYGGGVPELIGSVVEAKEDDIGLWIRAEFSSVQPAQDTRTKILEGHIKGLSIGYRPVKWQEEERDGKIVRRLTEIELGEVTVTSTPVNEEAVITSAKSGDVTTAPQVSGKSAHGSTAHAPAAPAKTPHDLTRLRADLVSKRARMSLLEN